MHALYLKSSPVDEVHTLLAQIALRLRLQHEELLERQAYATIKTETERATANLRSAQLAFIGSRNYRHVGENDQDYRRRAVARRENESAVDFKNRIVALRIDPKCPWSVLCLDLLSSRRRCSIKLHWGRRQSGGCIGRLTSTTPCILC